MSYRSKMLTFLLIGLCEALDPFNGTSGGPSNGGVTANRTGYSSAVFRSKMVSVLVSTLIVRTCDGEPDLAAVVFRGSVSWEDQVVFSYLDPCRPVGGRTTIARLTWPVGEIQGEFCVL